MLIRIALLGANGNGKSTFAKLLAGRLAPMGGRLVRANKLEVGSNARSQGRSSTAKDRNSRPVGNS